MKIPRFKVPTSQSSSLGQTQAHRTLKSSRLPSSQPRNILKSWPLLWQAKVRSPRIGAVAGKPIGTLPSENQSATDFCISSGSFNFLQDTSTACEGWEENPESDSWAQIPQPWDFSSRFFLNLLQLLFLFGDVVNAHNEWQSKFWFLLAGLGIVKDYIPSQVRQR